MAKPDPSYAHDLRHLIVVDTQFGWRGETEVDAASMRRLENRGWIAEGHENGEYDLTDKGRAVIAGALDPQHLTASEALFGFVGWLTSRDQVVEFSSTKDAGPAAELVGRFIDANTLAECRDGWNTLLTHPLELPAPIEKIYQGGNLLLIGQAEEIDTVRPEVRAMLDAGGFWLAGDSKRPELVVPIAVLNGEAWCMQLDCVLAPERWLDTLTLAGPFYPAGGEGDLTGEWEKEHGR